RGPPKGRPPLPAARPAIPRRAAGVHAPGCLCRPRGDAERAARAAAAGGGARRRGGPPRGAARRRLGRDLAPAPAGAAARARPAPPGLRPLHLGLHPQPKSRRRRASANRHIERRTIIVLCRSTTASLFASLVDRFRQFNCWNFLELIKRWHTHIVIRLVGRPCGFDNCTT